MITFFDLTLLLKALLAAFLGFVIGWEREDSGAPAGDRTFAPIAVGTTVLTAFALDTFHEGADRVIGGAVTGIGFLGTGVILRQSTGEVRGLTTAAGIWALTGLSVLIGAGRYLIAILLAALVLVILMWEDMPLVARLGLRNTRSSSTDESTREGKRHVDATPANGTPGTEQQGTKPADTTHVPPQP